MRPTSRGAGSRWQARASGQRWCRMPRTASSRPRRPWHWRSRRSRQARQGTLGSVVRQGAAGGPAEPRLVQCSQQGALGRPAGGSSGGGGSSSSRNGCEAQKAAPERSYIRIAQQCTRSLHLLLCPGAGGGCGAGRGEAGGGRQRGGGAPVGGGAAGGCGGQRGGWWGPGWASLSCVPLLLWFICSSSFIRSFSDD